MKPDLSQAEVEALLGEEVCDQDVIATRDFNRPMRVGPAQLTSIRKKISSSLPAVEQGMMTRFGGALALTLVHIEETTRSSFLNSIDDDGFFVQSFTVNGQNGWVSWAPTDARRVIEKSLGCGGGAVSDTPLSGLERSLAGGFATEIAAKLSSELGFTMSEGDQFTMKRLLQASIDASPVDDEQRLSITLELSTDSFSSKLYLYLPGVKPTEEQRTQRESPDSLPEHLNDVEVVLSAELASLELPLQEFLNLEEGDVIALGPKGEMHALLTLDGHAAGTATYGRDGERLALQVEELRVLPTN